MLRLASSQPTLLGLSLVLFSAASQLQIHPVAKGPHLHQVPKLAVCQAVPWNCSAHGFIYFLQALLPSYWADSKCLFLHQWLLLLLSGLLRLQSCKEPEWGQERQEWPLQPVKEEGKDTNSMLQDFDFFVSKKNDMDWLLLNACWVTLPWYWVTIAMQAFLPLQLAEGICWMAIAMSWWFFPTVSLWLFSSNKGIPIAVQCHCFEMPQCKRVILHSMPTSTARLNPHHL